jgi:hypothetical protein
VTYYVNPSKGYFQELATLILEISRGPELQPGISFLSAVILDVVFKKSGFENDPFKGGYTNLRFKPLVYSKKQKRL